ncbi:MAG: WD40/YVTN/BNR-like repeat-containing protein, partial [Janthinobacterium lividum]
MKPRSRPLLFGVLAGLAGSALPGPGWAAFHDPIDTAAPQIISASAQPMLAVATAGGHRVAVGSRGVALAWDPDARRWMQSMVPVQSDLVAISLLPSGEGWACGHGGVVLHSSDGGRHWTRQLDGPGAQRQFAAYLQAHPVPAGQADDPARDQIQLNFKPGSSPLPWLGIWFGNAGTGYIVGSFGDIASSSDGGATWQPWLDHVENPNFLDLNAIANIGGQLYIVGEQGMVYIRDATTGRFAQHATGYNGSLFGLTGTLKTLLVFGLRGTVLRSTDAGLTWTRSDNPLPTTILTGVAMPDGRFVLGTVDGQILTSRDDGRSFRAEQPAVPLAVVDMAVAGDHELAIASLEGVSMVPFR